jgi:hypothetical protein
LVNFLVNPSNSSFINTSNALWPEFKTALISNLPAYRHGKEYVIPFINMYWGLEEDIKNIEGTQAIMLEDLRRIFDFIITLEELILRNINL